MALTTTTLSGAVAIGDTSLTVAAYTAPTGLSFLSRAWMLVDSELMLVTDTSLSPTLQVVRGYNGTQARAHSNLAGVQYGVPGDFSTYNGQQTPGSGFYYRAQRDSAQEVTATGATGSTAAVVTAYPGAFLNATGASGTGLNLPVPQVGDRFFIKNNGTGALNVYSVGATINGTTGTTAFAVTATGDKGALAHCATSGAWQVFLTT